MTSSSDLGQKLRRVASSTAPQLFRSGRTTRIKQAARHWVYMHESTMIPEAFPKDVWPGIESVKGCCDLDMSYTYELPFGERALLAGVVQFKQPKLLFEFGTFTGLTTVLLADVAPEGSVVHTIDQPDSSFPAGGFDGWFTTDMVGSKFLDEQRFQGKIVLHRADLRTFDFDEFHGKVDLVFVDAAHSYEAVLEDSRLAFDLVAPGGTIIWDDYQPAQWGVVRALNEIAQERPLKRVQYTRFAVCQL